MNMSASSRSLTIGVLVILSLLIFFQGIHVPRFQSALSTDPYDHNNINGVFVGEVATDMLDKTGSRIYRADGIEPAGTVQELKMSSDEQHAILQPKAQEIEDYDEGEEDKLIQPGQAEAPELLDEMEDDGEEQEGDWHMNQVEAAKAALKHKEEQEEDWHKNQVAKAKEIAKSHG